MSFSQSEMRKPYRYHSFHKKAGQGGEQAGVSLSSLCLSPGLLFESEKRGRTGNQIFAKSAALFKRRDQAGWAGRETGVRQGIFWSEETFGFGFLDTFFLPFPSSPSHPLFALTGELTFFLPSPPGVAVASTPTQKALKRRATSGRGGREPRHCFSSHTRPPLSL